MSDVFISYFRRDIDFVRYLFDQLKDREPWVDWQDIPLTAESLNEVYAGIQTAGAFLFITSSDFASLRDMYFGDRTHHNLDLDSVKIPLYWS